tara:strand:- start:42 stop:4964 length:4923 start_codon:yes stop_codon:yes gene_type:complete
MPQYDFTDAVNPFKVKDEDDFTDAINPFEDEKEEKDFTGAVNPFKVKDENDFTDAINPLKNKKTSLKTQVDAVVPVPKEEKEEEEPEYITVYDRGNTSRRVNKAEWLAEQQKKGEFVEKEIKGFIPDVKRILHRAERNVTESVVEYFSLEKQLKNIPEKQKDVIIEKFTSELFGDFKHRKIYDPDVVDKNGVIKPLETMLGEVTNLGGLILVGGGIKKAAQKYMPTLTTSAANILGFEASTQLFTNVDDNIFNAIQDSMVEEGQSEEEADYFGSTVVNFMAANEEDTIHVKQLKLLVEGLGISAVMGIVGKGFTGSRQALLGKRVDEMTREELDDAAMKYFKEAKERQTVFKEGVDETDEGLAQVIAQNADGKKLFGIKGSGFKQRTKDTIEASTTIIKKIKQQALTERGYMTPLMFEAALNSKYGQRQIINKAENVANRLNIAVSSAEGSPKLLEKVAVLLESDLSSAFKVKPEKRVAFFAKQRNIPEDVAEAVLDAREMIDDLSTQILNTKGFSDEAYEAIQSNLKTYMRRSYRLFEDSGYVPTDVVKKRAIEHLAEGNASKVISAINEKGLEISEKKMAGIVFRANRKATREVDNLIGNTDELRDYVSQVKRVGKFYKKNETLSVEMKELLGEIDNPSENIILTISKAARIAEMQKYYNTVKDLGQSKYIFNAGTEAAAGARYNVKIEGTNSALDGQYTTQEMAMALARREETYAVVEADNLGGAIARAYIGQKGLVQALKTTYSHVTHARNVLGGYQFGLANGRLISHVSVGKEGSASAVLRNKIFNSKGRVNKKELDKAYEEYLGLGVINTSVNVNQFREMLETGFRGSNTTLNKIKKSKLGDAALGKPNEIYMGSDDFFKIGAYEAELKTLLEAFPNADKLLMKREAAKIVANTMPNYDLIPKGLKAMRAMPFGNFVAFPAEITRTSLMIMKQAANEISSSSSIIRKRGLQRAAGFATTLSGFSLAANASYDYMGFSDEEVEARRVLNSGAFSDGYNLTYFRMENGKVGFINTQYLDSYQSFKAPAQTFLKEMIDGKLKGKELDKRLMNAAEESILEFLKPYTSESIASGPLTSIATAMFDEQGKDYKGRTIFGPKGVDAMALLELTGKVYEPGTFTSLRKLYRGETGTPNSQADYQNPLFTRIEQSGIKPQEENLKRGFERKIMDYKVLDRQVYLDNLNVKSTSSESAKDLLATNAVEFQNQAELYVAVNSARVLLDRVPTAAILINKGFTSEKASAIIAGRFTPVDPLKDSIVKKMDLLQKLKTPRERQEFKDMLSESEWDSIQVFKRLSQLSILDATGFKAEVEEIEEQRKEGRLPLFATGGEISEPVANAPTEPDERINKLTGLPYNEGAGAAYMDADDPLRAMNMAAGGRVKKSIGSKVVRGVLNVAEALKKTPEAVEEAVEEVVETAAQRKARRVAENSDSSETQIGSTEGTAKKAIAYLDEQGAEGLTLDYGAGFGKNAKAVKADETFEPFPKEGFKPSYIDSALIPEGRFGRLISTNVLNVLPRDIRDDAVLTIGKSLKEGGQAVVQAWDISAIKARLKGKNFKTGEEANSSRSLEGGKFQKGFSKAELRDYVQETLGDGFEVSTVPNKRGISMSSVLIKKLAKEEERLQKNCGGKVLDTLRRNQT